MISRLGDWIGKDATREDVLRRMAMYHQTLQYDGKWYLTQSYGGGLHISPVDEGIIDNLIADKMLTKTQRLTHKGIQEGRRLHFLYVNGKI